MAELKKEKSSVYSFTLIFEYQKGKPINFRYRIEKNDYGTFYMIVSNFFTDEIEEKYLKKIAKIYPEAKTKKENLRGIFSRDFVVNGVETISGHKYKISWAT